MDTVDLLITGGEVITHTRRKYANVVVHDGKITGVLNADASLPKAQKTIDATGLYVLPGAVDPHTHIGGATKVVGNLSAAMKVCTRALAIGGTTTVMEMIPPTKGLSLKAGLAEAKAARRGTMAIDFAFNPSLASVDDQVIAGLEECAADGTPSFHGSFEGARGREPLDEGGLYRLLNLARNRKMMAVIHAEDARLNREVIRQTDNAGTARILVRPGFGAAYRLAGRGDFCRRYPLDVGVQSVIGHDPFGRVVVSNIEFALAAALAGVDCGVVENLIARHTRRCRIGAAETGEPARGTGNQFYPDMDRFAGGLKAYDLDRVEVGAVLQRGDISHFRIRAGVAGREPIGGPAAVEIADDTSVDVKVVVRGRVIGRIGVCPI